MSTQGTNAQHVFLVKGKSNLKRFDSPVRRTKLSYVSKVPLVLADLVAKTLLFRPNPEERTQCKPARPCAQIPWYKTARLSVGMTILYWRGGVTRGKPKIKNSPWRTTTLKYSLTQATTKQRGATPLKTLVKSVIYVSKQIKKVTFGEKRLDATTHALDLLGDIDVQHARREKYSSHRYGTTLGEGIM